MIVYEYLIHSLNCQDIHSSLNSYKRRQNLSHGKLQPAKHCDLNQSRFLLTAVPKNMAKTTIKIPLQPINQSKLGTHHGILPATKWTIQTGARPSMREEMFKWLGNKILLTKRLQIFVTVILCAIQYLDA